MTTPTQVLDDLKAEGWTPSYIMVGPSATLNQQERSRIMIRVGTLLERFERGGLITVDLALVHPDYPGDTTVVPLTTGFG